MIKCFYERNKTNFGDMLTPIILEWISGDKVEYIKGKEPGKLLCIGSGMNRWLRPNDIVWGYGSRNTDQYGPIKVPAGVKFWAVRGKMTYENILKDNPGLKVPAVFGDPGSLMPRIYQPKVEKQYKLGFIPHYIDKDVNAVVDEEINIIDIQAEPYRVIDEINKCEVIVSTSMHGLIVSDAYGVPVVWLKVSDKVLGAWFKFNDYFSSVGRGQHSPVVMMDGPVDAKFLWSIRGETLPEPVVNTDPLVAAWKGKKRASI